MESITHRTVEANGITMHIAEKGNGPIVLLLHGFPELWYSWRHQILGLAAHGYHAVAPDLRGYGDTSAPPSPASYTVFHLVGDLIALLDSLAQQQQQQQQQQQVFVVGHDWGAILAWHLCMFRPERVKALVNLSVTFLPRNPAMSLTDHFQAIYGDEYYVSRFQEPGEVEAEFARLGTSLVMKKCLTLRDPGPLFIPKAGWGSPGDQITLPCWLSEEDVEYYTSKFDRSGFTGGINYYRALQSDWELTAPWAGAQIQVPVKFIVGDLDLTYHYPGIQDYIHKGGFKRDVPLLDEVVVMEGVGHFINQEKADEITEHIHDFVKKF